MKWYFAHCSICGRDKFKEDEVQAFRIEKHEDSIKIEPIELDGRAPWCGITCICKKCLEAWKEYHFAAENLAIAVATEDLLASVREEGCDVEGARLATGESDDDN